MMKHVLSRVLVVASLAAAGITNSGLLLAQLPQTRLASLFPAGAQRGTTAEVTITGGTDLDEVDQLIFSHPGITAAPKLDASGNPVASTFVVTVDATVPVGFYDARVRGLFGISNPRMFHVDTLPESVETEPNNVPEQAMTVSLNSLINARANSATDVDYFRFRVEAGQTIVVRTESASLDSVLQPRLQLYTSSGRRLVETRRVFRRDASLVYTSDVAQELLLKVADVVFAGGADYVYRLAVDTRPLVDAVLPMVVSTSQPTQLTLYGRHLPGGQPTDITVEGVRLQRLTQDLPAVVAGESLAGFAAYSATVNGFWWNGLDGNLIPLTASNQSGTVEVEGSADQLVTVPMEMSGQFGSVGDEDSYRFQATKGDSWVIRVFAQRQGSIADPVLMVEQVVKAADGAETFKRLATEDDEKQNPGGNDLPTLTADPSFQLSVPEDGTYRIRVRDRYGDSRGDPRLTYRISVQKPEPDFRLVVFDAFPSADGKAAVTMGASSLRKGGNYPLTVYAYRQDGHNEPIRIQADELPDGVSCAPVVIGPGQSAATLVLTASEVASELARPIRITGRSGDPEKGLVRRARVATLIHDAVNGLPRTARMSDSLVVGVMKDEQPFSINVDAIQVDLSQDQQLLVPVTLKRRGGFEGKVDFTFIGVPGNVDAPAFAIDKGSEQAVARLFIKDNAGVSVNTIVVSGTAAVPWRRNPWLADRAAQSVKDAEADLATRQKMAADTTAALTAATQSVKAADERISALGQEIAELAAKQQPIRDEFAKSLTAWKSSVTELEAVKQKLSAVQASQSGTPEEYDKALREVGDAATAAEAASAKLAALSVEAKKHSDQIAAAKQAEAEKLAEKTAMESRLPELKKAAEAAQAAVAAAEKVVTESQARKTAADAAAKKANDATRANNVNVRTVSVPLVVAIHPTPAKITASVPNGGAAKKGSTLPVKVTLARKNGFAGAMQVVLVVPPGTRGIFSDTVEIAANATEATMTIAVAAEAPAGDVANAVLRATGDMNGRTASVDVPVAIKVTE